METEITKFNKLFDSMKPQLCELASLAVEAMSTSGTDEEAVIFCIQPTAGMEHFISRLSSNVTTPGDFDCAVTSFEGAFIQGVAGQGFVQEVSLMVSEGWQNKYLRPTSSGHIACFFFMDGLVFREEILPKTKALH